MQSSVLPQANLRSTTSSKLRTDRQTRRNRVLPAGSMLGWYTIASEEALMSVTDAEAISDVADRLFEAIEQSDIAMVEQLWNPDVIVWKVADRDRDRERAMRVIAWFVNTTTDRRYEILDRQFFTAVSYSNTSCTPTVATADRSR